MESFFIIISFCIRKIFLIKTKGNHKTKNLSSSCTDTLMTAERETIVKNKVVKMEKKKISVIGCGISGMTAIKSCIEEQFDVVCYEKTDNIGGMWKYRDDHVNDIA